MSPAKVLAAVDSFCIAAVTSLGAFPTAGTGSLVFMFPNAEPEAFFIAWVVVLASLCPAFSASGFTESTPSVTDCAMSAISCDGEFILSPERIPLNRPFAASTENSFASLKTLL